MILLMGYNFPFTSSTCNAHSGHSFMGYTQLAISLQETKREEREEREGRVSRIKEIHRLKDKTVLYKVQAKLKTNLNYA